MDYKKALGLKTVFKRSRKYKDVYAIKPDEFFALLSEMMNVYGIDTPLRKCHFVAQLCHECDHFKTTEEYQSGVYYEGRKDLGNFNAGDGIRYKGRGLIQVTGRYNYTKFTKWCNKRYDPVNFVDYPELIASDVYYSILSAIWFWRTHNLNIHADKNDIRKITRIINGGYNGLEDRKLNFKKLWEYSEGLNLKK